MDKKSIQAAVDALILLRFAQQQVQQESQQGIPGQVIPVELSPGATTPLFKPNISNTELAKISILSHNQDWQIPERAAHVINVALDKAGYNQNTQYSPEQINNFATAVATDLQAFVSSFGSIIQDLAV